MIVLYDTISIMYRIIVLLYLLFCKGVFDLRTKWTVMSWFHFERMGWFHSCVQFELEHGMSWFRSCVRLESGM
jgi:hypothetical protein